MTDHERHLRAALELAYDNLTNASGEPFGAVLVRDGKVIATAVNLIHQTGDPTAHAEMEAIRAAAKVEDLRAHDSYIMYASGQPCPMCLAAMYMAGIEEFFYAYSYEDAEAHGSSSRTLVDTLAKALDEQPIRSTHLPVRLEREDIYQLWARRA